MTGDLPSQWHHLASRAGISTETAEAIFQDLSRRYAELGRAYHNLEHIAVMLNILSGPFAQVNDDVALRLAVWFHDAVYDTRRHDNEEESPAWAVGILTRVGVPLGVCTRIQHLILATKSHEASPGDADCQWLLDSDLAILGSNPAEYEQYARAIRQEYAWVPESDYRKGRCRVLRSFLERTRIYLTEPLYAAREQAARDNLKREIGLLA